MKKRTKRTRTKLYEAVKAMLEKTPVELGVHELAALTRGCIAVGLVLQDSKGNVYLIPTNER